MARYRSLQGLQYKIPVLMHKFWILSIGEKGANCGGFGHAGL